VSDTAGPMDIRRIAKAFGLLFLLNWIAGIAGRVLLAPVYSDPLFLLGESAGTGVYVGAVFDRQRAPRQRNDQSSSFVHVPRRRVTPQ
jgi:hypothetical protein